MLEAEVFRLGFCRFIRPVLQSLRSRRLSESALTFQSEQKRAIRFWPLPPQTLTFSAGAVKWWLTDNRVDRR